MELSVAEVLRRWPETARVFNEHNMGCVGCSLASFCTVGDAAVAYQLPLDSFLAELQQVIESCQSYWTDGTDM
jgi:hybrid cluster-associated redox disulfide protein